MFILDENDEKPEKDIPESETENKAEPEVDAEKSETLVSDETKPDSELTEKVSFYTSFLPSNHKHYIISLRQGKLIQRSY